MMYALHNVKLGNVVYPNVELRVYEFPDGTWGIWSNINLSVARNRYPLFADAECAAKQTFDNLRRYAISSKSENAA